MRALRFAPLFAVLLAHTACSEPLHPAMKRPDSSPRFTGTYVGSGLSVVDPTYSGTSGDSTVVSRGGGYVGSGH